MLGLWIFLYRNVKKTFGFGGLRGFARRYSLGRGLRNGEVQLLRRLHRLRDIAILERALATKHENRIDLGTRHLLPTTLEILCSSTLVEM